MCFLFTVLAQLKYNALSENALSIVLTSTTNERMRDLYLKDTYSVNHIPEILQFRALIEILPYSVPST